MGQDDEREDGVSFYIPRKLAASMLAVVLAGIFGGISYPVVNMVSPTRYDPFTGQQGVALEARISHLEDENASLKRELAAHSKNAEQWKYRIIALEEKLKK